MNWFQEENPDSDMTFLDSMGWLPLAVITVILTCHALGCLPVIHVLAGELYPTDIRPLGVGISHSILCTFDAINVKTYPQQLETLQVSVALTVVRGSLPSTK
jgi:Sugar (and other) transporter